MWGFSKNWLTKKKKDKEKISLDTSSLQLSPEEANRKLKLLLDRSSDIHMPFGVLTRFPPEYFRHSTDGFLPKRTKPLKKSVGYE